LQLSKNSVSFQINAGKFVSVWHQINATFSA
jgi:hypothetical protein